MKSRHIKRKQLESQDLSHAESQQIEVISCPEMKAQANKWLANQPIKRVSPMTFSQKLYQPNLREIAEESAQAIEADSLAEIRKQLDRVIELGD